MDHSMKSPDDSGKGARSRWRAGGYRKLRRWGRGICRIGWIDVGGGSIVWGLAGCSGGKAWGVQALKSGSGRESEPDPALRFRWP